MSMTLEQFDEWFDTEDGQMQFYEYLYDQYPEMGKHQLMDAVESGDYVEEFADSLEVTQ